MTDDKYWFWRKALAQGSYAGLPLHAEEPHPGFYRTRGRKGWQAVAITPDGECFVDACEGDAKVVWTDCLRFPPISYELYSAVAEEGQPWPSDLPPMIGSNSGEPIAPELEMIEQVKERAVQLDRWLKGIGGEPRSEQEVSRLGNFLRFFQEKKGAAEKAREAEKKPILEAGRAIDAKWKAVTSRAEAQQDICSRILAKLLQARKEAAREAAEPPPPPRVITDGRAVGLTTIKRVEVTSLDALFDHYAKDPRFRGHPDLRKILERFAKADLHQGQDVPGATITEDHRAA